MLFVFLVIALVCAVLELFTGTFYLAVVAVAALLTAIGGLWLPPDFLHWLFFALCVVLLPVGMLLRHRLAANTRELADFDVGQAVTIVSGPGPDQHFLVTYRGSEWSAVVDEGPSPCPGSTAVILRKTDNLLHLRVTPQESPTLESPCPRS